MARYILASGVIADIPDGEEVPPGARPWLDEAGHPVPGIVIESGGKKGHKWTRSHGVPTLAVPLSPARKSSRMSGSPKRKPLGTSTIIPNPSNPALVVMADDVSVQAGGTPRNNPTVAAGEATAPTAAQVIADSGPMAAGTYLVETRLGFDGVPGAGKALKVEHRNAANAATLFVLARIPGQTNAEYKTERIVLADQERIRVIVGAVAAAANEVAQAQIRLYKLGA